ncbi:hypothetical protein SAMN02799631_06033 [Methylobacterium sp. 174MFSha1.1]|uniref:hypothetical protein n=1 Tax=Methylobacterium sp. 174MFSha1.1 TaxID=1502749 RepID=UPI0008E9EA7F|nr:hypothetical protein [Methylobacterium sp. 174MFSha1.1]SFV15122.1 hypothetical protein SAMN02799631_06033 [Methylobacterium sp. 174MFSha1.1]
MQSDGFNVLVCGKIRDINEFQKIIDTYRIWKSQGKINRVVYSGWDTDYSLVRDYIVSAADWGLESIISPEPALTTMGYIFHQQKALRFGLSTFNDGDLIIKSRTDKAILDLDVSKLQRRFALAPAPSPNSPFKHRVLIFAALILQPFFFNDMTYVGRADDLVKFASSNLWYEFYNTCINAEQAIHSSPFVVGDPLIRDYFMVNPGLIHDDIDKALLLQKKVLYHPFFQQILGRSLTALRDSYMIGIDYDAFTPRLDRVHSLIDLVDVGAALNENGINFTPGANSINLWRQDVFDYLISLPSTQNDQTTVIDGVLKTEQTSDLVILGQAAEDFSNFMSDFPVSNKIVPPNKFSNVRYVYGRISLVIGK